MTSSHPAAYRADVQDLIKEAYLGLKDQDEDHHCLESDKQHNACDDQLPEAQDGHSNYAGTGRTSITWASSSSAQTHSSHLPYDVAPPAVAAIRSSHPTTSSTHASRNGTTKADGKSQKGYPSQHPEGVAESGNRLAGSKTPQQSPQIVSILPNDGGVVLAHPSIPPTVHAKLVPCDIATKFIVARQA